MISLIKTHQLASYFILAYFFSWVIGVPLALSVQGYIFPLPLSLHYLTTYGPMLAVITVTGFVGGSAGLKNLYMGIINWKVGFGWYLFAFSPIFLFILISLLKALFTGSVIELSLLGEVNFLPNLGIFALPFWVLTSGVGEEAGWRGFALPKLQSKYSALKATLILSLFWIGWHLPAFFYLPNYMAMGLGVLPMFILGIVTGALVYTWLFNSTKGSILMAVLFHGAFNYITASKAGEGFAAAIATALVMIWGVAVIFIHKPGNLSTNNKITY